MPRKLRPNRTPVKPSVVNCLEDDQQSRFVFTVDPQCIITFPIDHCLYVCDICSSVLKTQEAFKKHYIKLHINHAHAALSDLKFCEAFPINLSKFKEDEGCFRCHFCIGLFFTNKCELKSHLNQHGPLQEIPDDTSLVLEDLKMKQNLKTDEVEENHEAAPLELRPCNYSEDLKIPLPFLPTQQSDEPVAIMTLNELPPLPNPNLPTPSGFLNSLPESLVSLPTKCNENAIETEPLSGLLGSSLLALFNSSSSSASSNALPDNLSICIESTINLSQNERSSSPIFAQDCPSSKKSLLDLSISCCSRTSVAPVQQTSSDVCALSSNHTLTLPVFGESPELTSLSRGIVNSSPSSSSGFSSASTEDLLQFDDNDVFGSSLVRSEESFSSVTSSKSNSDEEAYPNNKNSIDINIDNIVLSCLFCDKIFASIKSIKTHMLKSHQSKGKHWECVFCKTNFNNCDLLLNHLCSNHADIYFACISCKVRFDTKALMDSHFQNKHNSENSTKVMSKLSESKIKDDILHQLKCIPYYTNQNVICNSLSKKMKLIVFDKLSFSNKGFTQRRVTNKSVQVTEDDISQDTSEDLPLAFNHTSSILKRKLTKDLPTLPNGYTSQNKIIKISKEFAGISNGIDNFQSKLPGKSNCTSCVIDSMEEVVIDKSQGIVDDFLCDADNADKYLMKPELKLELDLENQIKILCLFCSKISFSKKSNATHIARNHKMKRGGKYCCFCRSNFRTLDLLFNHLCSNHAHVYFACTFCRERFDSKSSLLIHFESEHDSVNINKEATSEDLSKPNDIKKEMFMLELNCFPNNPSKALCLSSCYCSVCESPNNKTVIQSKAMTTVLKISDMSFSQFGINLSESGIVQDKLPSQTSLEIPLISGESANTLKFQTELKASNQEVLLKNELEPVINLTSVISMSNDYKEMDPKSMETSCQLNSSLNSSLELTCSPKSLPDGVKLICLYCDRTFDKAKAYRVHLYRSHKARKNTCMFCETLFVIHDDLFAHLLSTHSNEYFICTVCKRRFESQSLLNEHEANHTPFKALDQLPISTEIVEKSNLPVNIEKSKSPEKVISSPSEIALDTTIPNCVPVVNNEFCSKTIIDKDNSANEDILIGYKSRLELDGNSQIVELKPSDEKSNSLKVLKPGREAKSTEELKCSGGIENSKESVHEKDERKDESRGEVRPSVSYNHRQLVKYKQPEYENIAARNYSELDITVQLEILNKVKDFSSGKHTIQYPLKKSQRQLKTNGTSGRREFSGEWARAKNYFCANCGSHFVNFWDFDVHRWNAHPNVSCSVYDFYVEDTPPCYFEENSWPYNRVPKQTTVLMKQPVSVLNQCTMCGKTCISASSFHKHLIACAQHSKLQNSKTKRLSWKDPDKHTLNKRKRRSCRGLKSILDTPPKLPPSHVFNTDRKSPRARIKATNGVQKRLLSDKTNRRLSFYNNKNFNIIESEFNRESQGEVMLRTRSQSATSNMLNDGLDIQAPAADESQ